MNHPTESGSAEQKTGPSLTFTDAAALKASDLIAQEEKDGLSLRVFIVEIGRAHV